MSVKVFQYTRSGSTRNPQCYTEVFFTGEHAKRVVRGDKVYKAGPSFCFDGHLIMPDKLMEEEVDRLGTDTKITREMIQKLLMRRRCGS